MTNDLYVDSWAQTNSWRSCNLSPGSHPQQSSKQLVSMFQI